MACNQFPFFGWDLFRLHWRKGQYDKFPDWLTVSMLSDIEMDWMSHGGRTKGTSRGSVGRPEVVRWRSKYGVSYTVYKHTVHIYTMSHRGMKETQGSLHVASGNSYLQCQCLALINTNASYPTPIHIIQKDVFPGGPARGHQHDIYTRRLVPLFNEEHVSRSSSFRIVTFQSPRSD